ncbi:MAG: DUF2130 domain-containing protein [Phycisphaerales bacterium]
MNSAPPPAPAVSSPITCPGCGATIELTQALARPLIDAARADFEHAARLKDADIARREEALRAQARSLEESRAAIAAQVESQVLQRTKAIQEAASRSAQQQAALDLQRARDDAAAKDALIAQRDLQLAHAAKSELELRRERQQLTLEREQFDLTLQRTLDAERARVRESAMTDAAEHYRLRAAEKDKLIADMQRRLEDLQRKAEQGSQQLQGEVQELDLEALLRARFPRDLIEPVPKGSFGGDVLHRVVNDAGEIVGTIIWESKRTRTWSDAWLAKLRDDQRAACAELAVILSSAMPKGIDTFEHIDGVWVTGYKAAVPLTVSLRQALLEAAAARRAADGLASKAELLYAYMVGPRFKQRVEAILEAFSVLSDDLDKEKKAVMRLWAKRQEQIDRVMQTTAGMVGDLQGIAGRAMPSIKSLELPLLDASQPTQ